MAWEGGDGPFRLGRRHRPVSSTGGAIPYAERVRAARARIERRITDAGGDLRRITIVAVTKGHGPEAVLAARDAGIADIGENYAAELVSKAGTIGAETAVRWHYLGAIQRNKIPRLAPIVSVWQSLSRVEEAVAIARRSPGTAPEVFVEVDLTSAPGRGGCPPDQLASVVDGARGAGCRVRGLMTVAPLVGTSAAEGATAEMAEGAKREAARRAFGRCAELARELGLDELSMGMTADLEEAVAAGTTMVRIGTALFGPRRPKVPT